MNFWGLMQTRLTYFEYFLHGLKVLLTTKGAKNNRSFTFGS